MYTQTEYSPEDFSQDAINRGQRKINYALTTVDNQLIKVLEELIKAIAIGLGKDAVNFKLVEALLTKATQISNNVASIKPPGCDEGTPN
jgi:hypothetical protein